MGINAKCMDLRHPVRTGKGQKEDSLKCQVLGFSTRQRVKQLLSESY